MALQEIAPGLEAFLTALLLPWCAVNNVQWTRAIANLDTTKTSLQRIKFLLPNESLLYLAFYGIFVTFARFSLY